MGNKEKELKLEIIYGKKKVDGKNKDGETEKIYKDEVDTYHYYYLVDFLKTHFKDEEELQASVGKVNANSIYYEIQKLGHIVFAENTSPNSKHKTGIFYMPQGISDKQKKALDSLRKFLEGGEYFITLFTNLSRDEEGIMRGTTMQGKSDILKEFISTELEM